MSSGRPVRGLVDTPLLIGIRTGEPEPVQFALDMLTSYAIEMSPLSAMGLVGRCQDAPGLAILLNFLVNSKVHAVSVRVSRRAFRIMSQLPLPPGLTPEDAIIAATALDRKLPLYTLNPDRFAPPGLSALRPY